MEARGGADFWKTRPFEKNTFFGRHGPTPFYTKRQNIYVLWVIFNSARRARECSERVRFFSFFVALRLSHIFPRESEKKPLPEQASKRQMPLYVAYSRSSKVAFGDLCHLKHSTGAFDDKKGQKTKGDCGGLRDVHRETVEGPMWLGTHKYVDETHDTKGRAFFSRGGFRIFLGNRNLFALWPLQ